MSIRESELESCTLIVRCKALTGISRRRSDIQVVAHWKGHRQERESGRRRECSKSVAGFNEDGDGAGVDNTCMERAR